MAEQGFHLLLSRAPYDHIDDRVGRIPMSERARSALVPSRNLHQSWSLAHPPHMREKLLQLCCSIQSRAFLSPLVRATSSRRPDRGYLWKLIGPGKKPDAFVDLQNELRRTSLQLEIDDEHKHSQHVTLAYFAPDPLVVGELQPIPWLIDHVELVEVVGRGNDYRYETVYRKDLDPRDPSSSAQATLF